MKALLLDIGGVLYLSRPDELFWLRWAERAGCDAQSLRDGLWFGPDIEKTNIGLLTEAEYVARTAKRLSLDVSLILSMLRDVFAGGFNVELADYVREVRAYGVEVWALTNNWSTESELMARPELTPLFDGIVSSCDVGFIKPDPKIYHLTLKRLNRMAPDVIFVDDTPECVNVAKAIGMGAVYFKSTDQVIKELKILLNQANIL